MTSSQVLDLLNAIGAESSKNSKIAMVAGGMVDPLFKKVCEYAYNPFKTYGVQQMPKRDGGAEDCDFDVRTWEVLDKLIDRELSGDAAREAIRKEINWLNEKSADLFIRILRKDLKAGFSESTCNKVCKGLIPDFPYMRCSLPKDADLSAWPWERGVISQEKADGMFVNLSVEADGVFMTTRQGSPIPDESMHEFIQDAKKLLSAGCQYHGEIVVERDGEILERQIGNGILNSVLNGGSFGPGERPIYFVWDMVPLEYIVTKGKYKTGYRQRLSALIIALKTDASNSSVRLIPTRICKSMDEALAHYRDLLNQGKEGTVIKRPDAIWKDGTSKEQIKFKLEVDVDLEIIAIQPGKIGSKNEGRSGALTCISHGGQLQVDVAVKNETMRVEVDANPEDWLGKIVTVRANAIMYPSASNDQHSLFLPRMVEACYRKDKTDADSLQRVIDQFESAVAA